MKGQNPGYINYLGSSDATMALIATYFFLFPSQSLYTNFVVYSLQLKNFQQSAVWLLPFFFVKDFIQLFSIREGPYPGVFGGYTMGNVGGFIWGTLVYFMLAKIQKQQNIPKTFQYDYLKIYQKFLSLLFYGLLFYLYQTTSEENIKNGKSKDMYLNFYVEPENYQMLQNLKFQFINKDEKLASTLEELNSENIQKIKEISGEKLIDTIKEAQICIKRDHQFGECSNAYNKFYEKTKKLYKLYTFMPRYAILLFDKSEDFLNERRQLFMVGATSYFILQMYIENIWLQILLNEIFTHVYFMVVLEEVQETIAIPFILKALTIFSIQMWACLQENKFFYNTIIVILYQLVVIFSTNKQKKMQQYVKINSQPQSSTHNRIEKFMHAQWLDDQTIVAANYFDIFVLDMKSGKIISNLTLNATSSKKFYYGKIPFFYDQEKQILITFSKHPQDTSDENQNDENHQQNELDEDNIRSQNFEEKKTYINIITLPKLQIIKSIPAPNYQYNPRFMTYEPSNTSFVYATTQVFSNGNINKINIVNIFNNKLSQEIVLNEQWVYNMIYSNKIINEIHHSYFLIGLSDNRNHYKVYQKIEDFQIKKDNFNFQKQQNISKIQTDNQFCQQDCVNSLERNCFNQITDQKQQQLYSNNNNQNTKNCLPVSKFSQQIQQNLKKNKSLLRYHTQKQIKRNQVQEILNKNKKQFEYLKDLYFELSIISVEKINQDFICFSSTWQISLFSTDNFQKVKVITDKPFYSLLRHLSEDFYYTIDNFQHQQAIVFKDLDEQKVIREFRETELQRSECLRINYRQKTFRYFCKSTNTINNISEQKFTYLATSYNIQGDDFCNSTPTQNANINHNNNINNTNLQYHNQINVNKNIQL
ncbi:hypothetical protein PPERSA_10174 [Pseudocohnilembus persalinus]|uniref:Transmembrane protein n=1 Tax=Pseudocohnilembus persalinus TaxID=266149 RepID=A0A0V0QMA4_PSEPJ|nr:hypothetical protein PPERSA_10174 [Pseudocohnilembus persalinus]|eukprot:KRX03093.1 hypothetical protein PPERSA_10174 [Pseudocohnilembus persalinus]